jgi:large subunit ribosomal protein L25
MSEKILVKVKNREPYSTNSSRRLRKQGFIPATIYGPNETYNISLERAEFEKIFFKVGEHTIIFIDIDSKGERKVLIKDYQVNPVNKKLIHVDFLLITEDRPIKTHIPIKIIGSPKGAKLGGILEQFLTSVKIKSLPKDLPHLFEIDVSDLGILESKKIKDIVPPNGVTILNSPTQTIAGVVTSRMAKEAAAGVPGTEGTGDSEDSESSD